MSLVCGRRHLETHGQRNHVNSTERSQVCRQSCGLLAVMVLTSLDLTSSNLALAVVPHAKKQTNKNHTSMNYTILCFAKFVRKFFYLLLFLFKDLTVYCLPFSVVMMSHSTLELSKLSKLCTNFLLPQTYTYYPGYTSIRMDFSFTLPTLFLTGIELLKLPFYCIIFWLSY